MTAAGSEQWDRYWAYGNLHSFSQVAAGNYQGAIADFWRERFREPVPGMHVVDIATGNGAVALLALEAADAAGIAVDVSGVDRASIDPLNQVQDPVLRESLQRVRFHPRTAAEALPFADASVDLVCSQFGLEYSNTGESIREIGRAGRRDAGIALILHHADSLPLQATAEEIAQLDFVLDDARLWVHARTLLRAMAEQGRAGAGRGKPGVEKKRRALNDALQSIRREAQGRDNPRMLLGPTNYIHEIFSAVGRAPFPRLLKLLEETRQRVIANRQRLQDMQQAACSEDDLHAIERLLAGQGFGGVDSGPLHEHDGSLLGWYLVARRK